MSDPVFLAVRCSKVDTTGCVDDRFWVYVHTDPSNANVHCDLTSADGVTVINPPGLTTGAASPYNKIFRIVDLPSGKAFRLHVKATDRGGARGDAHHSVLVCRRNTVQSGITARATTSISVDPLPNPVSAANGFMVCGYVSPTTASMSAWITPENGGATIGGVAVVPPPVPYDWAFCFPGPLQAGVVYDLTIQAVTSSTTTTTTSFTPQ